MHTIPYYRMLGYNNGGAESLSVYTDASIVIDIGKSLSKGQRANLVKMLRTGVLSTIHGASCALFKLLLGGMQTPTWIKARECGVYNVLINMEDQAVGEAQRALVTLLGGKPHSAYRFTYSLASRDISLATIANISVNYGWSLTEKVLWAIDMVQAGRLLTIHQMPGPPWEISRDPTPTGAQS